MSITFPKWKLIRTDVLFSVLIWIFIFEKITIYNSLPAWTDDLLQVGCIAVMMGILVIRAIKKIPVKADAVVVLELLLLFSGTWQDILAMDMSGLRRAFAYSLPIFMYLFIINVWSKKETIAKPLILIPMIYGVFAAVTGMLLFLMCFFDIPAYMRNVYIPKEGRSYNLSIYGIGGFEPFGSIAGHVLGRVRGYFVEPTRMAAFLVIPLFLFWGMYRKKKSRSVLILFLITAGGFLVTMSRAGYITVVGALVIMAFARSGKNKVFADNRATNYDIRKFIVLPILAFIMIELLLHGMVALSERFPDAEFLSVGIVDPETGQAHLFRSETFDFEYIIPKFIERPWGYGLSQTTHRGDYYYDLDTNLSSAILLWPMAGGLPGLIIMVILLMYLFFNYCIPCLKSQDPMDNSIGALFTAQMINSVNVGNWMTPEFLLIVAVMVAMKRKRLEL
ncbi:MAG: hypothetical protein J6N76_04295 [Lachnospiraceae bacterium]|nr:hypothetical protein [Lachnospiraceae bacterium]